MMKLARTVLLLLLVVSVSMKLQEEDFEIALDASLDSLENSL